MKSQRPRPRGRGRYSLSSCVVSLGAHNRCAWPGADLHQGGGEQATKPYPCLPLQCALKLPLSSKICFRNPRSPSCASAMQHLVASGFVSQPDLLGPHSSPSHLHVAPSPDMSPSLHPPLLTLESSFSPLQCLQETFLYVHLYKTPFQGHRSGLD